MEDSSRGDGLEIEAHLSPDELPDKNVCLIYWSVYLVFSLFESLFGLLAFPIYVNVKIALFLHMVIPFTLGIPFTLRNKVLLGLVLKFLKKNLPEIFNAYACSISFSNGKSQEVSSEEVEGVASVQADGGIVILSSDSSQVLSQTGQNRFFKICTLKVEVAIIDSKGDPVEGATIRLVSPHFEGIDMPVVSSDIHGKFRLSLRYGVWTIEVSHQSYAVTYKTIEVLTGGTLSMTLHLSSLQKKKVCIENGHVDFGPAEGARLTIPVGTKFVFDEIIENDEDMQYKGSSIYVKYTFIDSTDSNQLLCFPGNFEAVCPNDGDSKILESFNAVYIDFETEESGRKLKLENGSFVKITMPIATQENLRGTYLWNYNFNAWHYANLGSRSVYRGKATFQVSSSGWKNIDKPWPRRLIEGRLTGDALRGLGSSRYNL